MISILKFISWPTIAGLLAAWIILDRLLTPGYTAGQQLPTESTSYARAVHTASPSVVNIYTAKLVKPRRNPLLDDPFFRNFSSAQSQRQRLEESLGSGVIMSGDGYILTNNHVIAGADAIQVLLQDGRSANAKVIGADLATDLAVLQIQLPDLQAVKPGDSEYIRVGDVVLAIGNPLGFGHSVTQGIVSALGRYGLQANTYEDYIQTDATIHQGNSGGALINTRGELLGINTLIYTTPGDSSAATGIGIGLAIPVNLAMFVMNDLVKYGEVIRGWLGVRVEPVRQLDSNIGQAQALVVVTVSAGSPAAKAGIRLNDIITHIDGEIVTDGRLTMHDIALLRPGDKINVTVQRNQQSIDLEAVIGSLKQAQSQPRQSK
ncbi:MAG: trypsin-like peptidase domain-containing protein [Halioglobus sp.]